MKPKHGYVSERLTSTKNNASQAGAGFEHKQGVVAADTLKAVKSLSYQSFWWETGWFKEWERVARHEG